MIRAAIVSMFPLICVGCMAAQGAKDRAVSEVTGVESAPPEGSSATDVLLYSVGSAIAGAVIGKFFPKKRGVA